MIPLLQASQHTLRLEQFAKLHNVPLDLMGNEASIQQTESIKRNADVLAMQQELQVLEEKKKKLERELDLLRRKSAREAP